MATLAMIKSRQTNNYISAQKIFNHLTFWRRKMQFSKKYLKFYRNWAIKKSSKISIIWNFWRNVLDEIFMIEIWTFLNENALISTQNGLIMI